MTDISATQLDLEQLDEVAGGMKWDHNYVSANVIDARGGSTTVAGFTFTYDVNGKLSGVSFTG